MSDLNGILNDGCPAGQGPEFVAACDATRELAAAEIERLEGELKGKSLANEALRKAVEAIEKQLAEAKAEIERKQQFIDTLNQQISQIQGGSSW